ncbi:MAG: DUF998 domain-containing protein [Solirubrobacterales bacterium]|nr:DUF998 domain-containing protein [Solirubrobacterales bacterium]
MLSLPAGITSRASSPGESAPALRRRRWARALASFAIAGQVSFVLAWIIAGALEPSYSPLHEYVSELGRRDAAHPWIFDLSTLIWGLGFISLGVALLPSAQARRGSSIAPGLFILAGLLAISLAPLRLDCAASVNQLCGARQHAGSLSWQEYGHVWAAFGLEVALLLTPFALAFSLWPGPFARLSLIGGSAVVALLAVLLISGIAAGAHTHDAGLDGLWQRFWLAVTNLWVLVCAIAVILGAIPSRTVPASGAAAPVDEPPPPVECPAG